MKLFFLLQLLILFNLPALKSQNIFEIIGNDSLALLQNGYIVGPNNIDCGRNEHTTSKWISVNGVSSLTLLTLQHRDFDKSTIYDQNNQIIWSWNGESSDETWYYRRHLVSVIGNSKVRLEFTQGFKDPYCNGKLQVVGISKDSINVSLASSISKSENNNSNGSSNKVDLNNFENLSLSDIKRDGKSVSLIIEEKLKQYVDISLTGLLKNRKSSMSIDEFKSIAIDSLIKIYPLIFEEESKALGGTMTKKQTEEFAEILYSFLKSYESRLENLYNLDEYQVQKKFETNKFSSYKLSDLTRGGKSVSEIISEKMEKALSKAFSEKLQSQMFGTTFDLGIYVTNAKKQIKEEEEESLSGEMTLAQTEEFNSIISQTIDNYAAKLNLGITLLNSANASNSSSSNTSGRNASPSSQSSNNIIGEPFKIGNLLVAQNDFPGYMTWEDAKFKCAKLGNGWRLPTEDELNILYEYKEKIGGFKNVLYWSFSPAKSSNPGAKDFDGGQQLFYPSTVREFAVRAVRNF